MPYTPPQSGAISVELAGGSAYTPPVSTSINVELAASDGFAGQVSFISVSGSLALYGNCISRTILSHALPQCDLTLAAYAPSYAITRTSSIDVAPSLTLTAQSAIHCDVHNAISAAASLSLAVHLPTYFCGRTQTIPEQGSLSLASQSPLPVQIATYHAPAGALSLSGQAIVFKAITSVDSAASLVLAGVGAIQQKQRVRHGVAGRYSLPNVLLEEWGSLQLAGQDAISTKLRVRKAIIASCGLMRRVSKAITGAYTGRVAKEVTAPYDMHGAVVAHYEARYSINATSLVRSAISSGYRLPIAAKIESAYALAQSYRVVNEVGAGYSMVSNQRVVNAVDSTYSYNRVIAALVSLSYNLTSHVAGSHSSYYDIESIRKVRTSVSGIYSSPDSQVIAITQAPYIEYAGGTLPIEEAEVVAVEGDQAWTCTLVLTDISKYSQLRRDQAFTVVIGVERYSFIVDSKELDRRNPANYAMRLMGISPSAKFTSPRMLSSSRTWDTPTLASDIAKELIPGLDWQVIDWVIPAYRFSIQDTTPIEAVKTLAGAIGATLEANLDGTLFVRSLYPVSVPNYSTATPAHTLLESVDIITVTESFVSSDIYNRLTITDVEQSISDSLEWIEDYAESTTGVVRAYLYPWRSGVTLKHTGRSSVSLASPELVMEKHEEYIEVFQGQGGAQYPIHHVESVAYEAQNTGSVVFDVDSRSFTVGGPSFNSVIYLVYWSRSLDYRASLPDAKPTQFLLESDPL